MDDRPQNPLSRWLPGLMYCYYYAQLLYILVTLEAWEILDATVLPLIPIIVFCYRRLRQ